MKKIITTLLELLGLTTYKKFITMSDEKEQVEHELTKARKTAESLKKELQEAECLLKDIAFKAASACTGKQEKDGSITVLNLAPLKVSGEKRGGEFALFVDRVPVHKYITPQQFGVYIKG